MGIASGDELKDTGGPMTGGNGDQRHFSHAQAVIGVDAPDGSKCLVE
jgi:hypothetical protein